MRMEFGIDKYLMPVMNKRKGKKKKKKEEEVDVGGN